MPTEIYTNVLSIADGFPGILLDAYGVIRDGNGLLPGAEQAMRTLVSQGKIVGILSNTTQLSEKEIKKLESQGLTLGTHYHFIVTSGDIARSSFMTGNLPFEAPSKKFYLFGEPHPRFSSPQALFEGTPFTETADLKEAGFIYITIPHIDGQDQTTIAPFAEKVQSLVSSKLQMVCANPDKFAHEGAPPRPVVRQGSIAHLYEQLGGTVAYFGKPSPAAYRFAMDRFEALGISDPSKVLMVGDTPETDIRGARLAGLASALVTETGIMADRGKEQELPSGDTPNFFIERI
jgi:HAD superfamily hydrolase (TIGR01459 family)